MISNMDKKEKVFWKVIALALVVVLYLFALNGRYVIEYKNINSVIYDKWKQKTLVYYPADVYQWQDWDEDPRN